ncbi:hypothetical protein FACS189447_07970 [Spirochaetia bacterium]|nr:hypothetical protein FACS189447_07970 [Spirochaetia bacterium]
MAKAKETGKFIVAPGFSFNGNKRIYAAGDEIDSSVFGNPKDFEHYQTCKPPRIIPAPAEPPKKGNDDKGGGNESGGGNTDPAETRKKLEALIIENGLGTAEDLPALSDDELKNILKNAGIEA